MTSMVRRCVAAGCSNTHSHNVSMHQFPKDPELRLKWEKQVQRTRDKWRATDNSFLCSDHFEADCFNVDSVLAEQMGLKKRRTLKPDAVPTIFVRHVATEQGEPGPSSGMIAGKRAPATTSSSSVGTDGPPKKRMAFEKRERLRVGRFFWMIIIFLILCKYCNRLYMSCFNLNLWWIRKKSPNQPVYRLKFLSLYLSVVSVMLEHRSIFPRKMHVYKPKLGQEQLV